MVSCTASALPLITKRAAAAAVRKRRHRPIFMVDLAVPRDIEPAVAELSDVYLFSIDDLQHIVEENRREREVAAGGARLPARGGSGAIRRRVARSGRRTRHSRAAASRPMRSASRPASRRGGCCSSGKSADEVIEYLANTLTNRLLHSPTQALRQASESTDPALAQMLVRLLTEERDRD